MAAETIRIVELNAEEAAAAVPALATVLMDCVEGGASVSFIAPLSREKAEAFWSKVAASVGRGETHLLAASDGEQLVGTVQLLVGLPENQPHRADVAKMLVHRRVRRRGIAEALMREVEAVALREGRTLLVLDTVTDSAAYRLYQRLGWVSVGEIPGYALWPDGAPCPTTIFYRQLESPGASLSHAIAGE